MRTFLLTALLTCLVAQPTASAQETQLASPFRPLDLPPASTARTASGRPGADYWQQRADYRIKASLDPSTHRLTGKETIRYHNNSPDALPYLWMHIESNMCAEGSVSNTLRQPPLVFLGSVFDFSCQGFVGGIMLETVRVNGAPIEAHVFGTTVRLDLAQPLASGQALSIEIEWSFTIPPYGMARMGRDGDLYEVAQWYPRMAVYDDVRGWNHEPYIGAGEFYLEYGDFDVELTLPSAFVVAATGVLQNPEEVLSAAQRARLALAMSREEPVQVITADEALAAGSRGGSESGGGAGSAGAAGSGGGAASAGAADAASAAGAAGAATKTWRLHADTVRDFAFAASPDFRWDATSWDGILIQTLYRPKATKWEEGIEMARTSIRDFSERWHRYPYPHATTVEGPIEGMEYPMLTFVPDSGSREDLHWVLAHEFGHQWFPMLVGSNERLHPWMDEGFNTFMDLEVAAGYFDGSEYGEGIQANPLRLYPENAVPGEEQAMGIPAAEQSNLFWTAYQKPALMLTLLRDEVLGRERFEFAFRQYILAWKNKHPRPADFIRIMRDASGMDLDWFWRGWLYSAARLDQAVTLVGRSVAGESVIFLENRMDMVMPLEMELTFEDSSVETVRLPVEMWNQGPKFAWMVPGSRKVTKVVVDPRSAYPDDDRSNNVWPR